MSCRKLLILASAFWSFSSAGFAADPVLYRPMTDHKPAVGVSMTVYLGDRMLEQRHGEYRDCVVPKFSHEKSMNLGVAKFVVKAGEPICKRTIQSKNYTPNYVNWLAGNQSSTWDVTIADRGSGRLDLCLIVMGVKSGCTKDKTGADFDRTPYFMHQPNSFQQTIEYAGKSGNVLKFIYSEYENGLARQAFTREFQVDLSEGPVLAYKGAVLEIATATNAQITYKVVRNFQQR